MAGLLRRSLGEFKAKGSDMGKGDNQKSNKEKKKPKKEKAKPPTTVSSASTRSGTEIAGKKVG